MLLFSKGRHYGSESHPSMTCRMLSGTLSRRMGVGCQKHDGTSGTPGAPQLSPFSTELPLLGYMYIYIWYHIYGLQTNAFLVFSFCLEWQNSLPSMMQKLPRLFCKRGFVQRWCCANESGSLIPVVDIRVSQSRTLAIFTAREVTTSRH